MNFRLMAGLAALLLAACQPILNTLTPSAGYAVARNVVYDAKTRLTLDVYRPSGARNVPVVVFFYGKRWSGGSREEYAFVGEALASEGFLAIVPDTRHYPEVRFDGFMRDAATAVLWAEQRAGRFGGDPQKLFVMGHSSGAHLAAMLALNPEYLSAVGSDRSHLRGMIGLSGPYDFMPIMAMDLRDMFGPPERFELSQPITFVDAEAPPLLLMHGRDDDTVPVDNTLNLAEQIAHYGGTVEKVIYPKMTHAWMIASVSSTLRDRSDVLDHIADFVRRRANEPARTVPVQTRPASPLQTRSLSDTRN